MKDILEILKYTLPSLINVLIVIFLVKKYFNNEKDKMHNNAYLKNLDIITPLRLQAYERFVLLLERISLENLVLRVNKAGMTSSELHSELLRAVRSEFDHNLSQQIYISHQAWEMIKNARSNVVHQINSTSEKVKADSPSINLSTALLESTMRSEKLPTADALIYLKEELNRVI